MIPPVGFKGTFSVCNGKIRGPRKHHLEKIAVGLGPKFQYVFKGGGEDPLNFMGNIPPAPSETDIQRSIKRGRYRRVKRERERGRQREK